MKEIRVQATCAICGTEFWFTTEDGYVAPGIVCQRCREAELAEMNRINEYEGWGPQGRPDPRRVL